MDNNIKLYRQKHPDCKWCKYHHYISKMEFFWEECELKDKHIYEKLNKIRAKFCKYYNLKEDDKWNIN